MGDGKFHILPPLTPHFPHAWDRTLRKGHVQLSERRGTDEATLGCHPPSWAAAHQSFPNFEASSVTCISTPSSKGVEASGQCAIIVITSFTPPSPTPRASHLSLLCFVRA